MKKQKPKTGNKAPTTRPRGRPFPKGVSGNPNGRPPRKVPSEAMYEMLLTASPKKLAKIQSEMPEPWRSRKDLTIMDLVCWRVICAALKPNGHSARKELFDRVEGRPTMRIAGPDGGPVQVESRRVFKHMTTDELRRHHDGKMTVAELRAIVHRITEQIGEIDGQEQAE